MKKTPSFKIQILLTVFVGILLFIFSVVIIVPFDNFYKIDDSSLFHLRISRAIENDDVDFSTFCFNEEINVDVIQPKNIELDPLAYDQEGCTVASSNRCTVDVPCATMAGSGTCGELTCQAPGCTSSPCNCGRSSTYQTGYCIGPDPNPGEYEPYIPPDAPYLCLVASMMPGGVTCFGYGACSPSAQYGT